MNQGARDANAESAHVGAQNIQKQILDELKEIRNLLHAIADRGDQRNLPEHLWPKQ